MRCLRTFDASHTAIENLPDSIVHAKQLVRLRLYSCKKLVKLPMHFGYVEGLRTFIARSTAIEELPHSFSGLVNLVELDLMYSRNLRNLPNNIWMLKSLKVLNLAFCSKLEQLPEQLGMMQCLEELRASDTTIEGLPDSIGLLSRLKVLDLRSCKNLKYLPNSMRNLTSLVTFIIHHKDIIRNGSELLKNMNRLECLALRCDIRLCLPVILNISSLKQLILTDEGKSFSSTKPLCNLSLSKLPNLHYLQLENCTGLGASFPDLPPNLTHLTLHNHALLQQMPNLSMKQLTSLCIESCISLQSLPPLPPHLLSLRVHNCTSLQDLPDLLMIKKLIYLSITECNNLKVISLEQGSLQVGKDNFPSFRATLPNMEIAGWFSHKRTGRAVSLDIPPNSGDNFLGVALWVVYKCKTTVPLSYIRAVIINETEGTKKNHDILIHTDTVSVQSNVECIRGDRISLRSGNRLHVSFQKSLYSSKGYLKVPTGVVEVEMCGAHVIQNSRVQLKFH
ncbi:uncharacterized protein LOC141720093 [Apium graveolens]|uniref:uncharacterized protein LOC141720093 n=1 Tax=Apium graveolens TaxID=4045 RepID=UPI003D7BE615